MTDAELRSLVRDAVARHFQGAAQPAPAFPLPPAPAHHAHAADSTDRPSRPHPSLALYLSVVNVGEACVIEPDVPCDHCGYCKSHGH